MADPSALPSAPRSRVVRSLARAAERPCARPGCPAPARATLTFSYATAEARLDRLADEVDPQGYDLCSRHAARTEAPRGWGLTDRRPEDDRIASEPPVVATRDLGSQATVDVLAAALRAVPEPAAPRPSAPAADRDAVVAGDAPRRAVVETLLAAPASVVPEAADPASGAPVDPAPPTARRDTRHEPTVELPSMAPPRRVPAAGDRGPATDW